MVRLAVARPRPGPARARGLVRELSEACSRCVSAWVGGPRRRRLRRLRRPAGDAWSPSSAARRRPSASATSPTTPCSTSSSRAPARPTWSRSSPTCAPGWRRWSPRPRSARRSSCRPASGARPARSRSPTRSPAWSASTSRRGSSPGRRTRSPSSPHRGDVRFTTRLMPDSPIGSISAVLHELGHALYEQGFPGDGRPHPGLRRALPRRPRVASRASGRTRSATRGRSGSRSSRPCAAIFPEAMTGIDAGLLHRAARVVRPSLIRVEADEVTYNLHIVLRFQTRARPAAGRPGGRGPPRGLRRRHAGAARHPPARATPSARCRTSTGPTASSATSRPTRSGTSTRPSWPRPPSRELGDIELVVAGGRFADILGFMRERVHRHGATPPHPRADAPGDGRRAELGRPHRPPRALLHLVVLGAARPRRARRSR